MSEQVQAEFITLPEEVRWTLERADGYLDLRMLEQAGKELSSVPKAHHHSTPYQELRLREAMERKEWHTACALAQTICDRLPDEPAFWVQLAYTTRRAIDIPTARSILKKAMRRFPNLAVIPYNLACYDCQLGNKEAASVLLGKAFQIDSGYRSLAYEDEDLEPLWDSLENA